MKETIEYDICANLLYALDLPNSRITDSDFLSIEVAISVEVGDQIEKL